LEKVADTGRHKNHSDTPAPLQPFHILRIVLIIVNKTSQKIIGTDWMINIVSDLLNPINSAVVTIYPNPDYSTLYLSTGNNLITVKSLKVYSFNSVLVYAVNTILPSSYALNIGEFPQGSYTAILELSDGSRQVKEFIKQ
jgi:hypothetical protein